MNNRVMNRRTRALTAIMALIGSYIAGAGAVDATEPESRTSLRLIVADSLPPPYLISAEEGREPTGLAIDVCRTVAARLGYGSTVMAAPPKRVPEMIRAGEADLLCHVSKLWYPYPEDLWFGRKLYSADNVLIAPAREPAICATCALPANIATVIGYHYGDRLAAAVKTGKTQRHDVRGEENVFRLVQHGRVNYGILSEYTFRYFIDGASDLAIKGSIARFNITVGAPKNGRIGEAELLIASASIRLPKDIDPRYHPYLGPAGR